MRRSAASITEVLRAAFATRDLRLLQIAWTAASVAHWAGFVAISIYAFRVGGAAGVGVVGFARLLPAALLTPLTSTIADRWSRRDTLVVSALLRLLAGLLLAGAALADAPLGAVIVLAALLAIAASPYRPAQSALLPGLATSPQQMAAANAIWTAIENLGFVFGALLGGLAMAQLTAGSALALTALPFGVAALLLARIPRDPTPAHREALEGSRIAHEATLGLRTVAADDELRVVVTTMTAATLVEGVLDTLIVVVSIELLGIGDAGVGYLNALWGIGGTIGGVVALGMLGRGRLAAGLAIGLLLVGVPVMALAGWSVTPVAVVAMLVLGTGYSLIETAGQTLLQRLTSDEMLARVFGVVEATYVAGTGIGALLGPLLIHAFGIRGALLIAGAALPLLAILRWRTLARFESGHPVPERPYELLRSVALFAPLPVANVENLSLRLEPVAMQAGTDVIRQGEDGDRFYVIDEGEVEVFVDEVLRRVCVPGDCFGEIALLHDVPRTATVRARTDGHLYALEREEFVSNVTGNPRASRAAATLISDRLDGDAPAKHP